MARLNWAQWIGVGLLVASGWCAVICCFVRGCRIQEWLGTE